MAIGESITPDNAAKESTNERPEDQSGGGVAAILSRRRLELGQDIETVAQQLRIRAVYLRAIEEGRLENLPGPAYAIGFVRAYADYLRLDGGSVVDDYREELAEGSRRNPLIWPADQVEHKHFPGTLVLILCLVLAGGLYGAWYYTSQPGSAGLEFLSNTAETIQPPAESATQIPAVAPSVPTNASPSQPADNQSDIVGTGGTNVAPVGPAAPESANAEASAGQVPTGQTQLVGNQVETEAPTANTVGEDEDEATPIPSEGDAAQQPTASMAVVAPTEASDSSATDANQAASSNQISDSQPLAGNVIAGTDANTVVSGTATSGVTTSGVATVPWASIPGSAVPEGTPAGRVQLRATQDSWIEIRNAANQVVMQRVLRAGETIAVPDLPGLVMVTGNAGGLNVEVDGKATPSLGPIGVVRRDISLDPAVLTGQ